MATGTGRKRTFLRDGARIVVVGGGPAGAFFALHLLRRARTMQWRVRVVIIERRMRGGCAESCSLGHGKPGCGHCAGGLSPRLNDALKALQVTLPPEVIQDRIRSITIQGYWKNIELEMPVGREMVSVFRMSRRGGAPEKRRNFDALLLECAAREGAELLAGEVVGAGRTPNGNPVVAYRGPRGGEFLEADFLVFAAGINAGEADGSSRPGPVQIMQQLQPRYLPPRLRRALMFELETAPGEATGLEGELHFVEYGSRTLRLEMCSLLPKSGCITVVLVGPSVDEAKTPMESRRIIKDFLRLPHIVHLLPPRAHWRVSCLCHPWMAVGTARQAYADGVAVTGDMLTSRLYKDGLLSAQQTAQALAETVLTWGTDERSLREAYAPIIRQFRRDNRYATRVFLLHRIVFSSSVLSRILYQAVITERKNQPASRRDLAMILWKIASGDEEYEAIFRRLSRPSTLWLLLGGGALITLRNYLTESLFGLNWKGFGRFTTGVAKERFEAKQRDFARALQSLGLPVAKAFDFERMYIIRVRAPATAVWAQLACFGEPGRGYLHPRGVRIERVQGSPNTPGCVIQYTLFRGLFTFRLELDRFLERRLMVYRVLDGFARGGVLLFEVESASPLSCNLSIYVAFNFPREQRRMARLFWGTFHRLFPDFVHDVIWNQALCQLKHLAEAGEAAAPATPRIQFPSEFLPASAPPNPTAVTCRLES